MVTDGAAAGSFADWRRLQGVNAMTPFFWAQFTGLRVFSGDAPGPPLEDLVARITAPLLLISADEHEEHDFNVLYDQAGGRRVEHWNLPDAHHTAAIRDSAEEYERRVVAFFDRSLDRNRQPHQAARMGPWTTSPSIPPSASATCTSRSPTSTVPPRSITTRSGSA